MKHARYIFFFGMIASSLYFFPSGMPQPADFIILLSIVVMLSLSIYKEDVLYGRSYMASLLCLLVWMFFVALIWSLFYPEGDFFKPVIFFIYNFLVSLLVINILSGSDSNRSSLSTVMQLALVVSGAGVVLSFIFPQYLIDRESGRISGFFNNPNQLGFYSLCLLAGILTINKGLIPKTMLFFIASALSVLGILASASLAAMASLGLILIGAVVANMKSMSKFLNVSFSVLVLSLTLIVIDLGFGGHLTGIVENRIGSLDRKVESMNEERGYNRISEFPAYVIFGAGEGAPHRFEHGSTKEIHSTFGNLIFSYGLIGLIIFLSIIYKSLRYAPFPVIIIISSTFLYSVTHMGMRTTVFWILLAISYAVFSAPSVIRSPFRN